MNKKIFAIIPLIIILSFRIFNADGGDGKILVVTSIGFLESIVKIIGGSRVEVFSIVPSNIDPHQFTITPETILKTSKADLIIVDGHIEWEYKLIEQLSKIKNMDAGKFSINLMEYKDNMTILDIPSETGISGKNYHGYWILPENVMFMAKVICNKLVEIDPNGVVEYNENLESFYRKMEILNDKIIDIKNENIGVNVVLGFLAEQYVAYMLGLKIFTVLSLEGGTYPNPRSLEAAYNILKNEGGFIMISDISMEMPVYNTIIDLAKQTGAPIIKVMIGANIDYISMMMYNIGKIEGALTPISMEKDYGQIQNIMITIALIIIIVVETTYLYKLKRMIK
ncbi:MAG: metal ABC transporter substrate-binding protein [Candidatus Methanomethylicia archaeon]